MHTRKVVTQKDGYAVIDCEGCGFKHLDPVPSEEELRHYYEKEYFQKDIPKTLNLEKEKAEKNWSALHYKDSEEVFNKGKDKRFLDIGSGNGLFAQFMKEKGWEVVCVEPSLESGKASSSLGLQVFNMTFEDFLLDWQKSGDSFDAINISFVLEHLIDPVKFLKSIRPLLNPDTVIRIEVPNDFSPIQQAALDVGIPIWWVRTPDHINYFDFDSLGNLLVRLEFEILKITTTFPIDFFILMGKNYVEKKELGVDCHGMRMDFEFNLPKDLRQQLYNSFAEQGIGRSCIFYVKTWGEC